MVGGREVRGVLPAVPVHPAGGVVVDDPVPGPLPRRGRQLDALLGRGVLARLVTPHVAVSRESVHRETSQRIPPLVLVNIKILSVVHRVDSRGAGGGSFEVGSAPATRVVPGGPVVGQAPDHAPGPALHLKKMAPAQ